LNVPVIALSQLSRAVETRGSSKRPCFLTFVNLERLRQDTDIIVLIPSRYYKIDEWDDDEASQQLVRQKS
jgi:replicative DNA helicase